MQCVTASPTGAETEADEGTRYASLDIEIPEICPSGLPDLVRVVPEISPPCFKWALISVFVLAALTRIATTFGVGNRELMSGYH